MWCSLTCEQYPDLPSGNQYLLHYAAIIGFHELIQVILERGGVDVNATIYYFETPLIAASKEGCDRCVELLLRYGADVHFEAKSGGTALLFAANNGHFRVVELLIRYGSDVNMICGCNYTPLRAAISSPFNTRAIINVLLRAGSQIEKDPLRPSILSSAAAHGLNNALSTFLDNGVSADATPPDANEGTALQFALSSNNITSARILVTAGADVRFCGGACWSPVSAAAAAIGRTKSLRFLLTECGLEPDFRDQEGRTALHAAAICQNAPAMEYLLRLGLKADQEDAKGWTAIHYAASVDDVIGLELLLATMSPSLRTNPHVWSPLHLACRSGGPETLDLLLEHGFVATTMTTSVPQHMWNLYAIARAYGNRRLVDNDGIPKHALLHICRKESSQVPLDHLFLKDRFWACDGCAIGSARIVSVTVQSRPFSCLTGQMDYVNSKYNPRFACTVCPDFDYCFMCMTTAEKTHAHPLAPSLMSYDDDGIEIICNND